MGTRLESTLQPQLQQILPLQHDNNLQIFRSTISCSEVISTTEWLIFFSPAVQEYHTR